MKKKYQKQKRIITQTEEDYYTCKRCEIDSLENSRMCPCPRGGCEAKISGTVIKTVELDTKISLEQDKRNQENYR